MMKTINVRLDVEDAELLAALCDELKVPQSQAVRFALRQYAQRVLTPAPEEEER